jgi:hypothetical protein
MSIESGPVVSSGAAVTKAARRYLRVAWASVAALPLSFVVAMLLGDWLLTVQGHESGSVPVPLEVALRAGIPALFVLVAPTIPAIWFGLRARRLGLANGLGPAIIGAVVAVGSVLQNAAGFVVGHWVG